MRLDLGKNSNINLLLTIKASNKRLPNALYKRVKILSIFFFTSIASAFLLREFRKLII
jgi:hypothetical protein